MPPDAAPFLLPWSMLPSQWVQVARSSKVPWQPEFITSMFKQERARVLFMNAFASDALRSTPRVAIPDLAFPSYRLQVVPVRVSFAALPVWAALLFCLPSAGSYSGSQQMRLAAHGPAAAATQEFYSCSACLDRGLVQRCTECSVHLIGVQRSRTKPFDRLS